LLGFVGVRGVVSLAAALAIPLTTHGRGPELPANYCRVGG
jgi:NhaP-type Na+/H+ or K+/H+ antiporter